MKVFILILAFILIAIVDIPALFKNKLWREFAACIVLLITGFTLSLLQVLGVNVPNPDKGIEYIIKLITFQ